MKHDNPPDAPTLFDAPPIYVRPPYVPKATLQEQFDAFHRANPWVATALLRLAVDLLNHGQSSFGIGLLYERLRWELLRNGAMGTGTGFMLNNNHRSRYSRLLVQMDPALDGVFEMRKLPSAVAS